MGVSEDTSKWRVVVLGAVHRLVRATKLVCLGAQSGVSEHHGLKSWMVVSHRQKRHRIQTDLRMMLPEVRGLTLCLKLSDLVGVPSAVLGFL